MILLLMVVFGAKKGLMKTQRNKLLVLCTMKDGLCELVKSLPKTPGIYKFIGNDSEILYIGNN